MEVLPQPNAHPLFARQENIKHSNTLQILMRETLHQIQDVEHEGRRACLNLSEIDALEALLNIKGNATTMQERLERILSVAIPMLNRMSHAEKVELIKDVPNEDTLSPETRFLRRIVADNDKGNLFPSLEHLVSQQPAGIDRKNSVATPFSQTTAPASEYSPWTTHDDESPSASPSKFGLRASHIFEDVVEQDTLLDDESSAPPSPGDLERQKTWTEIFEELKSDAETDSIEDWSPGQKFRTGEFSSNCPTPPHSEGEIIDENSKEYAEEKWFEEAAKFIDFSRRECYPHETEDATGSPDVTISDAFDGSRDSKGLENNQTNRVENFGWAGVAAKDLETGEPADDTDGRPTGGENRQHHRSASLVEIADGSDGIESDVPSDFEDLEGGFKSHESGHDQEDIPIQESLDEPQQLPPTGVETVSQDVVYEIAVEEHVLRSTLYIHKAPLS